MSSFSIAEQNVKNFFLVGEKVVFKGKTFEISHVGKPTCANGEPKTDIYILLTTNSERVEIKISYKKSNADFLENKITAERAEQLFGQDWKSIIEKSTSGIKDKFLNKKLIYKISKGKTSKGSITLGWKFELVNKLNGELSGKLALTRNQCLDIYSGNTLSKDKRDAMVNGEIIYNSGVANYILEGDTFLSAQDVLNKMETIENYVDSKQNIYFACKALNYRTFENKFDGNRPLAVQIKWDVIDNKLTPTFIFNKPLIWNGSAVLENLRFCLDKLSIINTDDVNPINTNRNYIHE